MKLYLDLEKAGQGQTGGKDNISGSRKAAKVRSSYEKQPVGVTGGGHTPDHPDKGGKWQHTEEDSVDTELEEDREKQRTKAADRNLIPEDEDAEEKSINKSFNSSANDLVKSIGMYVSSMSGLKKPSNTEREFLTEVMGFTEDDIRKGLAKIHGTDRHRFNEWLQDRLYKSLDALTGK